MNHKYIPFCLLVLAGACSEPSEAQDVRTNTHAAAEANAAAMTSSAHGRDTTKAVRSAEQILAANRTRPCLETSDDVVFGAEYRGGESGFTFWASETRVGYQSAGADMAELWVRSNEADVSYERWFMEDRRAIEYMSGDLRTIGRGATWADVRSPVPKKVLTQLDAGTRSKWGCLDAQAYGGDVDGVHWEVVWLPGLRIPAAFSHASPGHGVEERELVALLSRETAMAFFDMRTELAYMDFADIGDNESDPFVREVIEKGLVEHANHGAGHEH